MRETQPFVDQFVWRDIYYSTKFYLMFKERRMVPLFACESGSRAWGFESPNSDYDVRFVYRQPMESYLKLAPGRDTVQLKLDHGGLEVDAAGWDIRKFLQLAKKSNAQPVEWLFSCPTYAMHNEGHYLWYTRARGVLAEYCNPGQMAYHYRGMATKHWRRYIEGRDEVTHKKYLYLMRAVLMTMWYLEHLEDQIVAPGRFQALVMDLHMYLSQDVQSATSDLLLRKSRGQEMGESPPIPVLHDFIGEKLREWEGGFGIAISGTPGWSPLDDFFMWTLKNT